MMSCRISFKTLGYIKYILYGQHKREREREREKEGCKWRERLITQ